MKTPSRASALIFGTNKNLNCKLIKTNCGSLVSELGGQRESSSERAGMPSLRLFRRRWRCSSDDFVLVGCLGTALNIAWFGNKGRAAKEICAS